MALVLPAELGRAVVADQIPGFVGFLENGRLHGRNLNRTVEQASRARLHAEVIGAHHAANPTHGIGSQDHGRRPAIVRFLANPRGHDEIGG